MAASDYGILMKLEISARSKWVRFVVLVLLRTCELIIMLIIFGMVIRIKPQRSSANDVPAQQLGTFAND